MIEKDIESNVYQCSKCGGVCDSPDTVCKRCKDLNTAFLSVSLIVVSLIFLGSIIKFI
jgi:rubrerythrin